MLSSGLGAQFTLIAGKTLLHSLWEATVIAVGLAIAFFALRKASASIRYWLAVVALGACAVLPLVTAGILANNAFSVRQVAIPVISPEKVNSTSSATPANGQVPASPTASGFEEAFDHETTPFIPRARGSLNDSVTRGLKWVVLAWFAGLVFQLGRFTLSLRALSKLRARHTQPVPEFVERAVKRMLILQKVSVRVATRCSQVVDVPMIVGHLKPMLLIPVSALNGLTPTQLEMLIAHEVAHLRHYDHLINLLQGLIEAVFFFNPAVWWISRVVRQERECRCDAFAVSVCGGDRYNYSRALLSLEDSRKKRLAATAVASNGGSLVQRIRILSGQSPTARLYYPVHWLIGVLLIALPALVISVASAQSRGGTLRIAYASIQQLDPYKSASNDEMNAFSLVFDPLFIIGKDDFQPVPNLAESWETPDDTTWVFHLRQGVMFQDGNVVFEEGKAREVTAEDVVYSINRFQEVSTAFTLGAIDSVSALDRYTVEIKTNGPDPFLVTDPNRLTRAVIVPHEAIELLGEEGFARQPVGSGPFKLTAFTPDQKLTFVRNDDYWLPVNLDAVEFVFIPDPTVQTIALESGDVDVIPYLLNIDSLAQLSEDPNLVLLERGGSYRGLGFNVTAAPFDEIAVRDALSKALDIEGAVNAVVAPFGQRAYGQVPPWVAFTPDPTLKDLWVYDPEAALQELAEAGFTDSNGDGILDRDGKPLSFSLKTSAGSQVRVLTILVTQLQQLGIDAKILQQDTAVWSDDLIAGNTEVFFDYSFAGTTGLYSMFHGDNIGKTNTHHYSNPEVNRLLDEANRTIDFDARNSLWLAAQRLIMEDRAVIPMYFEGGYSITSKRVHDFVPPWGGLRLVSLENSVYLD